MNLTMREQSPFVRADPSEWHSGVVKRLLSFGAFVEVTLSGENATGEGLVHVSQVRDGFVENVSSELNVGQEVKVRVISVDETANQLSLSMREQGPFARADPSEWHSGVVTGVQPFGVFVEVTLSGENATGEGLVHTSRMNISSGENISDVVEVGQEVQVRVVSTDESSGQIKMSMRGPPIP